MKYTTLLWLFAAALTGFRCQQAATPFVTGHEPVKTSISGMVYRQDGTTPAAGARITIHPADLLFFPQETGLGKTIAARDTFLTNDKGAFTVDTSVPAGFYLIEAVQANNIALIDSVEVKTSEPTIATPPITLKPTGTIKGSVILYGSGNYRDIFVLAFGIDRFTRVQEDGSFCFSNLGEGTYSIRIVSLMEHYGVFDTTDIRIASADTTDLGAIILPFDGIPVPQNLTYTYDTLTLKVTLRWNSCVASKIRGYVLYRSLVDSNGAFSIIDTAYDTLTTDNTVLPYCRYEYRVAAMGKDSGNGVKSAGVTVTTTSSFTIDTVFDLMDVEGAPYGLSTISDNGDYYFTGAGCILVYDRDLNLKQKIGGQYLSRTEPEKITIDKNGLIFVLCRIPDSVLVMGSSSSTVTSHHATYIFNAAGTIVDSIGGSTPSLNGTVIDKRIYCIGDSGHSVMIYALDGTLVRSWHFSEFISRIIAQEGDSRIFLLCRNYEGIVCDTLGTILSRLQATSPAGRIDDIGYDFSKELLYVLTIVGRYPYRVVLYVFDSKNTLFATYYRIIENVHQGYSHLNLFANGDLFVGSIWMDLTNNQMTIRSELVRLNPLKR